MCKSNNIMSPLKRMERMGHVRKERALILVHLCSKIE